MLCKLCLYLGIYYRVYSRHLFRIIKENATSIGFKCTGHQKVGLWWNWMNYVRVLAQKPDFVFNKNPITVPLKKMTLYNNPNIKISNSIPTTTFKMR